MFCATADWCEIYLIKTFQLKSWVCTKKKKKTKHKMAWLANRDAEFLQKAKMWTERVWQWRRVSHISVMTHCRFITASYFCHPALDLPLDEGMAQSVSW